MWNKLALSWFCAMLCSMIWFQIIMVVIVVLLNDSLLQLVVLMIPSH